jgi:MoaA/NifB/PqqE/SkfB family radical SAM enzyme
MDICFSGENMGYSVGIGLTNDCNLNCAHCYRDRDRVWSISLNQVKRICETIAVDSVGMGTGENALHPEFIPIVEYLRDRGIRLSIASNGYSLKVIPEEVLSAFKDVEVSIDHPNQAQQDAWRGDGNWKLVHQAIERCRRLGIDVSILATLMKTNYREMDAMVGLARMNGANLRVNAYQAVKTDAYLLSYQEFWEGYRRLFAEGLVISCSEPVVRAVLGFKPVQSPCGRSSIRFNPRGQVIPCVYWPSNDHAPPMLDDLYRLGDQVLEDSSFVSARQIPASASNCSCQGGCASRRALNQTLDAHDPYCPWVRGETLALEWKAGPRKNLMRAGNVCTTIVV